MAKKPLGRPKLDSPKGTNAFVRLPEGDRERFKAEAEREGRTLSNFLRILIGLGHQKYRENTGQKINVKR
jgi:hypothetical protein